MQQAVAVLRDPRLHERPGRDDFLLQLQVVDDLHRARDADLRFRTVEAGFGGGAVLRLAAERLARAGVEEQPALVGAVHQHAAHARPAVFPRGQVAGRMVVQKLQDFGGGHRHPPERSADFRKAQIVLRISTRRSRVGKVLR